MGVFSVVQFLFLWEGPLILLLVSSLSLVSLLSLVSFLLLIYFSSLKVQTPKMGVQTLNAPFDFLNRVLLKTNSVFGILKGWKLS